MTHTHQKRPYRAHAVQWTGDNTPEIEAFFPPPVEVIPYDGHAYKTLMIRFAPGKIDTLRFGDWAVKGENGDVKFYNSDTFHTKYEEMT